MRKPLKEISVRSRCVRGSRGLCSRSGGPFSEELVVHQVLGDRIGDVEVGPFDAWVRRFGKMQFDVPRAFAVVPSPTQPGLEFAPHTVRPHCLVRYRALDRRGRDRQKPPGRQRMWRRPGSAPLCGPSGLLAVCLRPGGNPARQSLTEDNRPAGRQRAAGVAAGAHGGQSRPGGRPGSRGVPARVSRARRTSRGRGSSHGCSPSPKSWTLYRGITTKPPGLPRLFVGLCDGLLRFAVPRYLDLNHESIGP